MRSAYLAFLGPLLVGASVFAQVRSQYVKSDQILTVKAALGIATIVQVPDTIQSAIIGDQTAFKVEYLNKAVTIKPLRYGAKTNLYLMTEKRRYNLRLLTLGQDAADYIVYVQTNESVPSTKWQNINRFGEAGTLRLSLSRVGRSSEAFILLDGQISSRSGESTAIRPSDIWLFQEGKSKTINGLFLSDLTLSKGKPLLIGLSLSKSDLIAKKPLTIEIRSPQKISVTLSKELIWE